MMEAQRIAWFLEKFDLKTEALVEQWELIDVSLSELRESFERPSDDPMCESYLVTSAQKSWLEKVIDQTIDPDTGGYFVTGYRVDNT